MMLLTISLHWPFISLSNGDEAAVKKLTRHFEKIHATDYDYSLKRSDADLAASKMFRAVTAIKNITTKISDSAAIKKPLQEFLAKWNSQELIKQSLLDRNQQFMADVMAFSMRGLIKRKEVTGTVFPAYRP